MPRPAPFRLSAVVPCYNEQELIRQTHRRLSQVLGAISSDYEILYVDDGSGDQTSAVLGAIQRSDSHVRLVRFSRNFGHQVAVTAGMELAAGDAVVLIDADLQDPPELIAEFVSHWRTGYDVVYGQRTGRDGETLFKRATAALFYRGLRMATAIDIPRDVGDFRLLDRAVVDALVNMPETDRFLRGMVAWVGFRQMAIPYRRRARAAGQSKYPLGKMLRLAGDALVAFSPVPLRAVSLAGLGGFVLGTIGLLGVLWHGLATNNFNEHAAFSILVIVAASGQLAALGVLGEYVGRIYRQVQGRPLYVIAESRGFPQAEAAMPERRAA